MIGMLVVAVLRRTIAVASAPVARAIIDSILIAILARRIRAITAVASIATTTRSPASAATIISISIAIPIIAITACLLEPALVA